MQNILFDLDGTLIDSAPGIKHSAIKTLKEMKLPLIPYEDLDFFIGPPLSDCFRLCNVPEDRILEAISVFRKFYEQGEQLNCSFYPGIKECLISLKKRGYHLFVCTSKAEYFAVNILENFGFASYFDHIYGSSLDSSLSLKKDIIALCLSRHGKEALMVGDTYLDIIGANENHIPSIGVTWGYGEKEKMIQNHVSCFADNTEELLEKISCILPCHS